ncbi:MAG: prephenate dehydrogenase, partial [Candidatus Omnitrophota bacterium]|nr:prephenate dehydrogenase [Candidatus Omnitrophota bacterium]
TVKDFWKMLGSKIYELSPRDHDKRVSNISHLPHIAASCLSLTAQPASLKFAATGFRDVTRIASSDPNLWTSILMSNRGNAADDIKNYIKQLEKIRRMILYGNGDTLRSALVSAKKKRDKIFTNGR